MKTKMRFDFFFFFCVASQYVEQSQIAYTSKSVEQHRITHWKLLYWLTLFIYVPSVEIWFCLYHLLLFRSNKIMFGRPATLGSIESTVCSFIEIGLVLTWFRVSSRPVCLFEKLSFCFLVIFQLVLEGGREEPTRNLYLSSLANKSRSKMWS